MMAKTTTAKKKAQAQPKDYFVRKESENVVIKYNEEQLSEKNGALQKLAGEVFKIEREIEDGKRKIKDLRYKINGMADLINAGGEEDDQECEVRYFPKRMEKEIWFNGELQRSEELTKWDLQRSIDDLFEESEDDEEAKAEYENSIASGLIEKSEDDEPEEDENDEDNN